MVDQLSVGTVEGESSVQRVASGIILPCGAEAGDSILPPTALANRGNGTGIAMIMIGDGAAADARDARLRSTALSLAAVGGVPGGGAAADVPYWFAQLHPA
jgi:hypothetical protein